MNLIAGKSDNETPIISGEYIFNMIDSYGFPFYLILELLEENDLGFDVKGFIIKAKTSKNYENKDRLISLFRDNIRKSHNSEKIMKLVKLLIDKIYA
jgi:alanyl-tRNA synthetase